MSYGPALPPGFRTEQSDGETDASDAAATSYGSQLPTTTASSSAATSAERSVYGPPLPPTSAASARRTACGPTLPGADEKEIESRRAVTDTSDEDDEECVIGPLPVTQHTKEVLEREQRIAEVEARAEKMKGNLCGKGNEESEVPRREEWMTSLPPQVKAFGLGARKFRTRDVELGDRSVWTDTPADKFRKRRERAEGKITKKEQDTDSTLCTSARDDKLSVHVEEHNKACRSESLMEMHRKRRAEETDESKDIRRPFDREVDLKLPQNIITPAKRKALMKDSSTALKSKFSHGTQRFL